MRKILLDDEDKMVRINMTLRDETKKQLKLFMAKFDISTYDVALTLLLQFVKEENEQK